MNENKESYKKIHKNYKDIVWKPYLEPILKIATKIMINYEVEVEYEDEIPKDGSIIFAQNHSNIYDSFMAAKALKTEHFYCLASDEPRGKFDGIAFEARGVIWLNRNNQKSKKNSTEIIKEVLKYNEYISWCPEATWNLSENKLMLNISYGMAKNAIEASYYNKVYIMPVVIEYYYDEKNNKVIKAKIKVCKAIEINQNMDYIDLTEQITSIFWTKRWEFLEENAKNNPNSIKLNINGQDIYVEKRDVNEKNRWDKFSSYLRSQYKAEDWTTEDNFVLKTKEEKLQQEMQKYITGNEYNPKIRKLIKK